MKPVDDPLGDGGVDRELLRKLEQRDCWRRCRRR